MVSIIVPVYNVAPYLERCLISLRAQTREDIEILLVDDGSIDGSGKICDVSALKDRRIKVYHVPHAGAAAARNYGIERARGEYIAFVDGDDSISPRFVEKLLKKIEEKRCQIVVCGRKEYSEKTGQLFRLFTAPDDAIVSYRDYDFLGPYQHLTCWGALFDSRLVQSGLRFDSDFKVSEDTLFFMEALKKAGAFAVVPEALYNYSVRSGSLTHGAYNWDYYTEMLAWNRLIELSSDRPLRLRINTRGWLARKCTYALKRNRRYYKDRELHDLLVKELRENVRAAMLSSLKFKTKMGILLCSLFPNLYLVLRGQSSRYP